MIGLWKYVGAGGSLVMNSRDAAGVVEVDADDLRRLDGREVDGGVDGDLAPVAGDEDVAPSLDGRRVAVEQDASVFGARGRP